MDHLIAKQFAGEITPDESLQLAHWLDESPQHRAYYDQLTQLWELAPAAQPDTAAQFDTEAALGKVKHLIHHKKMASNWKTWRFYGVAAALALVLAAVWWLRPMPGPAPLELAALPDEVRSWTLPDGSAVTLNRGSGLSVEGHFNQKERRMALRGEAYFEVTPNPKQPFIVEAGPLEVKVLGTAFNVDQRSDEHKIVVSVTHGKVAVSAGKESHDLTAGTQAVYDMNTQKFDILTAEFQNPNVAAYRNRVFQFNATPLKDVAAALQKAYNVPVRIDQNALNNCPLTARYNNLSLERVMELIAASFSIKAEKQSDGSFLLSGTGCGE